MERCLSTLDRHFTLTLTLVILQLVLSLPARAQVTTGSITGTVFDVTQAGPLAGVTVSIRNLETGVVRTGISETDGWYRVGALPPGRYSLKAEMNGYAVVAIKELVLLVGSQLRQDLKLAVGGESVRQPLAYEFGGTEVSGVVRQEQIDTHPVADRQPVMLTLLQPTTSTDGTRTRRANANIGGGITYYSNAYLYDGAMTTAAKAGEPRQDFPQAAIREFKVNIGQSMAEFGGQTGGVVSVVTKSGTNIYTGEAFEFFRDKSLNALNKFEVGLPKPDFRRNTYGMSSGGPVVKNRLHYFAAYERTDQRQPFVVTTGKPALYSGLEGSFPNDYLNWMAFGRGDLSLTPRQTLFVRYSYLGRFLDCENCGGKNSAFSDTSSNLPADQMVSGHTWVLSDRATNEVRVQGPAHLWQHSSPPPGGPAGSLEVWKRPGEYPPERLTGMSPVYNFPSLVWGSASSNIYLSWYWEIKDDFTITAEKGGDHSLKFGFAYLKIHAQDDVAAMGLGTWTFSTDQFLDGTAASIANLKNPIQFTNTLPGVVRDFHPTWTSVYVQDQWKPRSNLTLNLGVRYDLQRNGWNEDLDLSIFPREIPFIDPSSRGDTDNVQPRIGLAWDVRNNGRSIVQAGYGRYYRNTRQTVPAGERVNLLQKNITIPNPSYPDPYQGRDPYSFVSTARQNISILRDDIRNPCANTVNVGWTQQLAPALSLKIDGFYTRTNSVEVTVNINTPDPITKVRPWPEWNRINEVQPVGNQTYKALMVRLDRRFANRHQYLLSYTLAKQDEDTAGGTRVDFYNPGADIGPGAGDRRHAFAASGAVLLPYDVTLGIVWSLRSAMPFDAVAGLDLNGDGAITDYVPGTSRNQGNRRLDLDVVNAWRAANGRGPVSADQIDSNRQNKIDVRAEKSLSLGGSRRVSFIAQVFNVFGTDNLLSVGSGYTTNALSDSFGRIFTSNPRQQAELAVRFVW
jgi:hypothetical protein